MAPTVIVWDNGGGSRKNCIVHSLKNFGSSLDLNVRFILRGLMMGIIMFQLQVRIHTYIQKVLMEPVSKSYDSYVTYLSMIMSTDVRRVWSADSIFEWEGN